MKHYILIHEGFFVFVFSNELCFLYFCILRKIIWVFSYVTTLLWKLRLTKWPVFIRAVVPELIWGIFPINNIWALLEIVFARRIAPH